MDVMYFVNIAGSFIVVGGGFAGIAIIIGHVLFGLFRTMEGGK